MGQLSDELKNWSKQNSISHQEIADKEVIKKYKEKLSKHDIKELMGINRPIYRRTRGSLRQR
ncbi:hypothetical protein LS684_04335 [Cytobacillus spongiae]|uniref:hypothetical protein n=1 Tax=Cytobacillus spongiae TaxID=2901381 RepID=UPI001F172666|nr:hypothetical protein [Cytobacillus spongiae]UII56699.1 hypothetical protein LS684_04335 [Cytobacillus spongiae]